MAKVFTADELHELREQGNEVEIGDNGRRTIQGLDELVGEIRSLVEAQRANAGADMLRSETQSQLIQAVQKLASRGPGKGVNQSVLEDLIVQLGQQQQLEPNPVYVFDIQRNETTQLINKIVATPQAS